MLSLSKEHVMEEAANRQAQIRYELVELNNKIHHLQMSEDERLAKELQAIEMDIKQAKSDIVSFLFLVLAFHKNDYLPPLLSDDGLRELYIGLDTSGRWICSGS